MNEHELAKRAVQRDTQAFLEIIQLYKETLYRTAFAFLKNEHDAIEAVQEVTVRAYNKIHTVKEPDYLKTWLVRIMMNYCQDQLRKNKRYTSSEGLQELGTHPNFTHLEIEEALAILPETEQRLIHLMYFQDTKIKDIAVIENIPEGTVKSRLHKTLRTLRNFLSEKGDVDHV
ncbi:sigma-70 family RNA polymerase sigma factor [Sporosarcina sp. FSL K6-1522]|uniref:sigma-70 family RNA polymerase sigma factor n=1 Tax=Sporosarcina sp. FSL K6-1522 TaxID=2921554 RepID=UPI00315B3BAD